MKEIRDGHKSMLHSLHYFMTCFLFFRNTCKTNPGLVSKFESSLFPIFHQILTSDVTGTACKQSYMFKVEFLCIVFLLYLCYLCCICVEFLLLFCLKFYHYCILFVEFLPYVFQVLSLLLEVRVDDIPEAYMQLFPSLLTPLLWERVGKSKASVVKRDYVNK